ncbi:MAG: Kelch repeat-containing protein [Promethearchaeota archaeon]
MKKKVKYVSIVLAIIVISAGLVGIFIFVANSQNQTPLVNPTPLGRYGPGTVYDLRLQKLIIFGGGTQSSTGFELFDDMWTYNSTTNIWIETIPTNKPSPRSGHSMVYDSFNNKTILFGGWDENIGLTDQTWVFDSQLDQWTEFFPDSAPNNRQSHAMYYDPFFQRVILFGGYKDSLPHYSDTWEYNYSNNTWTELNPSTSPSGRYGSKMVYDPINQRAILFGGRGTTIMDDTWIYYYGNNTWTELSPTSNPDTRYWHGMVYDSNNHKVILFGGRHAGAPGEALEDTWIFDPSTNEWIEVLPLSHPSNRMDFSMVYDSNNQIAILFGGYRFSGNTLGDTWTYSYNSNSWSIVKGDDL